MSADFALAEGPVAYRVSIVTQPSSRVRGILEIIKPSIHLDFRRRTLLHTRLSVRLTYELLRISIYVKCG